MANPQKRVKTNVKIHFGRKTAAKTYFSSKTCSENPTFEQNLQRKLNFYVNLQREPNFCAKPAAKHGSLSKTFSENTLFQQNGPWYPTCLPSFTDASQATLQKPKKQPASNSHKISQKMVTRLTYHLLNHASSQTATNPREGPAAEA